MSSILRPLRPELDVSWSNILYPTFLFTSDLGCMTLIQGPNWGYRAQNGVIIGLHGPKTGPKLGYIGPKTLSKLSNSSKLNGVFLVVIIGLYDPKTGSKLGL
jgi:hypothetical protein